MPYASLIVHRAIEPDEAGRPSLLGVMEAMSVSEAKQEWMIHALISGLDDDVEHTTAIVGPDGDTLGPERTKAAPGGFIHWSVGVTWDDVEPGRAELKLLLDDEVVAGCFVVVLSDDDFAANLMA